MCVCVCVCVCDHERALHERLVCVRAVCVFSRACLRVDVSCACVGVACARSRACVALTSRVRARRHLLCVRSRRVCVHERACAAVVYARSRACAYSRRVCAFTSVRARRRLLCVCAVCVLSRALWTFGPFPAAKLIKYILIPPPWPSG